MSIVGKILIGVAALITVVAVGFIGSVAVPHLTKAGEPIVIGDGATRVQVTLVGPPKRVGDEGGGWCVVRCQLRFENVGQQLYHTTVYSWCTLTTTTQGDVAGQSPKGFLDDIFTETIEMDPGATAGASVDFRVRKDTGFKSFSYQGPDDIVGVWSF